MLFTKNNKVDMIIGYFSTRFRIAIFHFHPFQYVIKDIGFGNRIVLAGEFFMALNRNFISIHLKTYC